ncbi:MULTISPECIES: hypothetical protein [Methylobacterium]|uniref:hypothetical protein n=1 Tax=Methylobacterium TaxID=407 RepID=UPI0013EA481A|nr:hypothetical protein [Methylobacterium sp. DB0501]NGM39044.1 hypothetical protein [Methylobacterium sp. DB0501]
MRDIRPDLKERLAELDSRMSTLVAEYNRRKNELDKEFAERERELNDERSATGALLAIEQRRHGDATAPSSPTLTMGLADFLLNETRKKEMASKDDLRSAAALAGYFPNGESGGRAVHTTLLNLVRAGRLAEAADGLYYAPESLDLEKLVNSEKADVFS